MDVTCLRAFDFKSDYVFRYHHKNGLVGNIMKCPPKSDLMLFCYENALTSITAENKDWMLPLKILKSGIEELQLSKFILDISNKDAWPVVAKMLRINKSLPEHWYAIHWMNEEWRRLKISKDNYYKKSILGYLLEKHGIQYNFLSKSDLRNYFIKTSRVYYVWLSLMKKLKK